MKIFYNRVKDGDVNVVSEIVDDDDISFADYYENGKFERYALFFSNYRVRKVNVHDIKYIMKS